MLYLIQPLFAPNESMLNKNIRSISSLKKYLQKFDHPITYISGGFANDDVLWQKLNAEISSLNVPFVIERFDKNYGKAHVVNSLYNKHLKSKPHDYFLTYDSDIVFDVDLCPNLFERIVTVKDAAIKELKKPFGMVSLNQHVNGCHVLKDANSFEFSNSKSKEKILYPKTSYGVAGGCMLVDKNAWNDVGGYRVQGIYGGNDGWLINDLHHKNYSYMMSESIGIIHPPEDDASYVHWKVAQIKRLNGSIDDKKLNEMAQEAQNFWINK